MTDDPAHPEAVAALSETFALEPVQTRLQRGETVSLQDVRQYLVGHVARLLERNPAMLMSILYRIDVAEAEVKRVLAESTPAAIPGDLADLIIARQLQKVRLRRRYREGPP